jgi:hypothetical protein
MNSAAATAPGVALRGFFIRGSFLRGMAAQGIQEELVRKLAERIRIQRLRHQLRRRPGAGQPDLRAPSDPEPPALTAPPSLPAVRAGTLGAAR